MKIDCALVPDLISTDSITSKTAVVIDVLRATTVIVTALERGCPWIYPVRTPEEAREARDRLGVEKPLLAGERDGLRIDGFDSGNSPVEFSEFDFNGCPMIMTTTNGTEAILSVRDARRIYIGSFLNVPALVHTLTEMDDVCLVCSGTVGEVSLEDAACAGAIVDGLAVREGSIEISDAAYMTRTLYQYHKHALPTFLKCGSKHGRKLIEIGFERDIEYAARFGVSDVVPVYNPAQNMIFTEASK